MNTLKIPNRQDGVVLVVSLILLIGITLISLAVVDNSVVGMRMASNSEAGVSTFQIAQSAIDYTVSDNVNLPTSGPLNSPSFVNLMGPEFSVLPPDYIDTNALRTEDCRPPPRAGLGSSIIAFSAFHYEVNVEVDLTTGGGARLNMGQGYIQLGPKC